MMLVQTPVARVEPRWSAFMERWPDAGTCAAAPLEDILRAWQGLGYPRRALHLHQCAARLASGGWPTDERGLRGLPGVGAYIARALLTLSWERPCGPPREVNLSRVAARASLGAEAHELPETVLDTALDRGRPPGMTARHYTLALFDVGALHCRARPRCSGCPLGSGCGSRARLAFAPPPPPPRRQAPYAGTVRRLRGAILAAVLGERPPRTVAELRRRVAEVPAARPPGAVEAALDSLRREGLVGPGTLMPPGPRPPR
ncbi:MAG: A/G-specific adenine glycosylase [Candidatus Dormibacteria bacterium]